MDTIDAGLAGLREMGHTPVIRGMLWQQGESDAQDLETARAYGRNLARLIGSVRTALNAPKMLFAYGHVLPAANYTHKDHPATILRKQQNNVAQNSNHPLATRGALLVTTDNLSLRCDDANTPHPNDVVHFGTPGTLQLGTRFANAVADAMSTPANASD